MKADTDRSSERVWMFVHGELEGSERAAFAREMEDDSELRRLVERAERLDRTLRDLLPQAGSDDAGGQGLADEAQAAWERDQACAAAAASEPDAASHHRSRTLWRLSRSAAFGLGGLVAAAALVLVFSPAAWRAPGVSWAAPEFSPLALRGGGELSGRGAVDAAAAARCQAALRTAVEACAAERGAALPPGLVFSFRVQALRDGAFSVAVQARARDGRVAGEWCGDYSGVEAFLRHVKVSATRMVDEVASPPRKQGEGARP